MSHTCKPQTELSLPLPLQLAACKLATQLMEAARQVDEHLVMDRSEDPGKTYQAAMITCFNLGFEVRGGGREGGGREEGREGEKEGVRGEGGGGRGRGERRGERGREGRRKGGRREAEKEGRREGEK